MPSLNGLSYVHGSLARETSNTVGTGTYSLGGAVSTFRTFVSDVGSGTRVAYCARLGSDFEFGLGTATSGSPATLTRDYIDKSSNNDNAVNWLTSDPKDIYACPLPSALDQIFAQPALPELRAALNCNSGTAVTFTGISTAARRLTLTVRNITQTGAENLEIRVGPNSGPETTGYDGRPYKIQAPDTVQQGSGFTDGHRVTAAMAAGTDTYGEVTLTLHNSATNMWLISNRFQCRAADLSFWEGIGTKATTGPLTQIQFKLVGGTGSAFNGNGTAGLYIE